MQQKELSSLADDKVKNSKEYQSALTRKQRRMLERQSKKNFNKIEGKKHV